MDQSIYMIVVKISVGIAIAPSVFASRLLAGVCSPFHDCIPWTYNEAIPK